MKDITKNPLFEKQLKISYLEISTLSPYKNNPRTHTKAQIKKIARSIQEFGFTNPILIDDSNGIIAGHGRVLAAKELGMTSVPTVKLSQLSEAQKRAYIIADNRLAEDAGWDNELLTIELQGLLEIEFDVALTGFEIPEIDNLLHVVEPDYPEENSPIEPPDRTQPAITQPGDLWQLGRHTLFCGDATDPRSYRRVLGKRTAQMVFTDPPYNVPINHHVCGNGSITHPEFAMASGEMSSSEFIVFLSKVVSCLTTHSVNGSIHYLCMDWRHIDELLSATEKHYSEFKNLCIWNKDNGGMGSLYRSKHELVFVFKNGTAAHINNIELGKHGRYRTNVWDYPGVNSFKTSKSDTLALHPTVKPINLVADAILDCSKPHGLILDPFGGSGTTLLAAEKTDRNAALIEIDPHYCDVTLRRFQERTGIEPIHLQTQEAFSARDSLPAFATGEKS